MVMVAATQIRTDEQLQRDVLAELKWDARIQPNEIGVIVKDGVVTLTGWVDSYTKKWEAEQAALRVRGVKAVANDIEIRLPIEAERPDPDIARAAVEALEWDAGVPTDKVHANVSKGWVTLEGEVEWQYQKEAAERAVRRLTGVRGVTNLLVVKPHTSPTDLKLRIEDALIRNAELDARRIQVLVAGNKAILKGTVRSWAEREAAARAAWSAPGIAEVDNQIVVVP